MIPLRAMLSRLRRWRHRHLVFEPWNERDFGGISVSYQEHLDGGGMTFGQEYITFFAGLKMPPQQRAFEWCAGPGFIGFSLLAHGFCKSLFLADINKRATLACKRTIERNGLGANVAVYQSKGLRSIPRSEQWNLVVGNPPHFGDLYPDSLLDHDETWRIHREFFSSVLSFLAPGGVIVLQENNRGSTVDSFREMIETAGLQIAFVHGALPERTKEDHFYFLGLVRRGDVRPAWTLALRP